ncbi:DNA polymerase Y family protein [Caldinitratiruptor microaerophilus]|uniref:DNA polymerase IV n=1 Tax=Caldinitratiruptor microaerophilus TaxID=671077 RepID=A0AA35G6J2_9FIRM|nr:DNA polymerase IV [Caldinitratiruptor microaerophilus]BDG61396.1 DNA polymerase IV [Caldinitratiruptor microaerophilus]
MSDPVIALLDANAFYASVAVAVEPSLRGRPVVVAGDPHTRHGIVLSASYEARRLARGKVRAGMPLAQALRLLPRDVVVVPPDYRLYTDYSRRMFAIMRRFTPVVEVASIDEGWMDWTGCLHFHGGDPVRMALALKAAIRKELGILVSVGVAWSRVTAKMAAELEKPDGLTVLAPPDWPVRVWPLPVGELYGVGPRTVPKLEQMGIRTIGDLAGADPAVLRRRFGAFGEYMRAAALGQDGGRVDPQAGDEVKSISHSLTLPADAGDWVEQKAVLLSLADQVGRRLRKSGLMGRTVTLTIRDGRFRTITRARTLPRPTDLTEEIYGAAARLLEAHWPDGRPVRLLGVGVSQLVPAAEAYGQLTLFDEPDRVVRRRRADLAADALRDRFGEEAVMRGGQLLSRRGRRLLDKRAHGTSLQKDALRRHDDG